MSSRGAKKGENRPSHDPPPKPAAPQSRSEEDDAIEILEVVGVDETTGAEPPERRAGAAPAPPDAPASPSATRALQEALAEKEKFYDLLLRKQAEFENFRRRTDKERAELRAAVTADLVKRLLPALDNLDRALATSEGSNDPLRQGLLLVRQQFLEALRKEGIAPMDTLGARFDPRLHEAVQVLDVDRFEEGVILEEMRKGYTINDQLLRPALVKVASGRGSGGGDRERKA